ncbi:putative MFS family arabinose efflux permease [Actinoallomurus bryophytorum]|uniref:Putative MFS family arabinose efflux permease n=1 Tax=Actinoallomurus bryophytorum TaxID=1490222 RepID=A0A543CCT1_9ACTN|nr:MFS transporter [Actinoallomurus bryophytorum]TQL94810.1 putative MFS family arabinose efflux permease [Actinoallomurus bryophytorum]
MTCVEEQVSAPPPTRLPGFLHTRVGGLPRAFWALWAGSFVNRLGTMVEPFLAFYLTGVRGFSLAATGAVLALFGLGSVISQVLGGVLADRVGRRATLTGGMLATAAAMLALGYVTTTPVVIAVVFVLGVTIDMYRPASQALVADLVAPADRPRAYGLLFWAINLGFAVAMVLGGTLSRAGFSWLFWVDAATCAVYAVLIWRAVPETRVRRADREPGGFADVLRDRVAVASVLIVFGYAFVYLQAYSTLPLAMGHGGLPPQAYGLAMAVNGIGIVIIQPVAVGWLQRHDASRVLAAGMGVVGLGFGLTALAGSTLTFAATVLVWTVGEVLFAAVSMAIVADLAPPHLRGRYGGLYGTAFSVAALLGPLGGSWLLGHGTWLPWLTCAILCAASGTGALALAPAVRRRRSEALTV